MAKGNAGGNRGKKSKNMRSNNSCKIKIGDRGRRFSKSQVKRMMQRVRKGRKNSEILGADVEIAPVDVPFRNSENHDYVADNIRKRLGKSSGQSLLWMTNAWSYVSTFSLSASILSPIRMCWKMYGMINVWYGTFPYSM